MLPPRLFHYTSPAACISIVKTRELWATPYQYLNDSQEIRLALDIAGCIIDENYPRLTSGIIGETTKRVLKDLDAREIFVISFSENEDQLSQWRAYCNNGGISIGFSPEMFRRHGERHGNFYLDMCIYEEKIQWNYVNGVISQYLDQIDMQKASGKDESEFLEAMGKRFIRTLIGTAARLKHKSFKEEEEWRLIGNPDANHSCIDWRQRSDMIVPYLKYYLGDAPPIVSMCTGPARYPAEAWKAVKSLMNSQSWSNLREEDFHQTNTTFRGA